MARSFSNLLEKTENLDLLGKVRERALGQGEYDFSPFSCFIEYKQKELGTGIEFRDCIVDYTKCPNKNCIKKLV